MPAIAGADLGELSTVTDIDLAGIIGADLLSFFRVTFEDEGRFVWIEPDPTLLGAQTAQSGGPPAPLASPVPPPAVAPAPASSSGKR